jgi:hypothetical protein
MAIFLPFQTDSPAGCGNVNLAGIGIHSGALNVRLKRVGSVGTATQTVTCDPSVTRGGVFFQSENLGSMGAAGIGEPGVVTWDAGTWTVRLRVTTGNTNLSVQNSRVYIHAISGAGGCANVALIAQGGTGQTLTAGVKTFTLTTGSPTTVGENAQIYITIGITCAGLMQQNFQFVADQNIDTPIIIPNLRPMMGVGL